MWQYGLLHIVLIYSAVSLFGWLYGILFLIALVKTTDLILDKLGYVRLNFGDLMMSYEHPDVNHNIGGYFTLKKTDFESFKKEIYNRGIVHIRKLSQVKVHHLGIGFWKDTNFDVAKAQIMKCKENIKTDEQCVEHINKLVNERMPFDRPLWEMHLLENYSEDSSVLFMRMHHSFTDAMGFVSMMSFLNDDQFRLKIDKKFPRISIFMHIFFAIVGPIYVLYIILQLIFLPNDNEVAKINELKQKDTFNNKFYASEELPFASLKKCYKRFEKTTFNDYIMGVLSTSLDKWYKHYGITGAKNIKTVVTVNTRNLPTKMSELKLENNTVGEFCDMHVAGVILFWFQHISFV